MMLDFGDDAQFQAKHVGRRAKAHAAFRSLTSVGCVSPREIACASPSARCLSDKMVQNDEPLCDRLGSAMEREPVRNGSAHSAELSQAFHCTVRVRHSTRTLTE